MEDSILYHPILSEAPSIGKMSIHTPVSMDAQGEKEDSLYVKAVSQTRENVILDSLSSGDINLNLSDL